MCCLFRDPFSVPVCGKDLVRQMTEPGSIIRVLRFPEKEPARTIAAIVAVASFGLVTALYARLNLDDEFHWLQALDLVSCVLLTSLLIVIVPRRLWLRIPLAILLIAYFAVLNVGFVFYVRFYGAWPTADVLYQWRDAAGLGSSFAHLFTVTDVFIGLLVPVGLLLLSLHGAKFVRRGRMALVLLGLLVVGETVFEIEAAHPLLRSQNQPLMYLLRDAAISGVGERIFGNPAIRRVDKRIGKYYPTDENLYQYDRGKTSRLRKIPRDGRPEREFRKMNVLVVVLESVRSYEMGLYGAKHSLTPNLDKLGAKSLVFDPFYASAHQTQRAEAAIFCSLYERVAGGSIFTKHPRIHASCLPDLFLERGYHTLLLKSYKGNYANARTFFRNHGTREVHDILDFDSIPHLDIGWGPSDEDHYKHSLDVLDESKKPFFAELLSLSNHFPFKQSYPTDNVFPLPLPDGDYRNLARGIFYTDFAFGKLMEEIEKKPWFQDTLLVVVGDHGIWRFPEEVSNDMTKKLEIYFRVPLLIYTPNGMVQPGVNRTLGSQVDIPPTILDLLGLEVPNGFAGRSLLTGDTGQPRHVLMIHDDQWNIRRGNDYCYDSTGEFVEQKFYGPKRKKNARPGEMYCFHYKGDLMRDTITQMPPPDPRLRELRNFGRDLNAYNAYILKRDIIYRKPKR